MPMLAYSVVLASGPRMSTCDGVPIRTPKIASYSIDVGPCPAPNCPRQRRTVQG